MTRRQEFAELIPGIIASEHDGKPVHISEIYGAVERDHSALVDDEIETSTGAAKWKHDLRWELETLVVKGSIKRRKELGRGVYSS